MTLQEILELDKNRTQGKWADVTVAAEMGYSECIESSLEIDDGVLNRCQEASGADFDFIAAAPDMVRLLKEQQQQIADYKEALEVINKRDNDWGIRMTAGNALNKYKG